MLAINCEKLEFSVGSDVIISDITFSLNEGDRLGIVGVNGAGKSTLLNLIIGKYLATSGSVYLKKGATIAMLGQTDTVSGTSTPYEELLSCRKDLIEMEQQLASLTMRMDSGDVDAERTYHGLHDRFLSLGGYEYKSRLKGILKSLGFTGEQCENSCDKLSGGQKTRLALAKILYLSPDILLLDEPTNHLDTATLSWLEDFLRNYKKTVIIVSHDRYFLDRTVDKIFDIENGSGKLYNGNYSSFVEQKKKNREIEEKHYKNQQKEIARIEAYIALQKRWNRERNIIAAESRQKMLDRMEKLDKPKNEPGSIRLSFSAGIPSGEDVLTVTHLKMSFPGKTLFEDLSFEVKKGDRLLIIGHNGCGKSTLMKILMNRLSPLNGSVGYGHNLTIGYYDQENQNLSMSSTVLDELWNTDPTLTQTAVRSALALFRMTRDDVGKSVSVLSGGERARLTFAKLVLRENNLLLLDEPTNHLDILTKEVLEDALSDYDGTVVAVSHDRYFAEKMANAILDFDGIDGKPCYFKGTYKEYMRYIELHQTYADTLAEKENITDSKQRYLENKKNAAEQRKLKNRLEKAKKEADTLERLLEELGTDEIKYATDYMKLSEISQKREEQEEKLLLLYEEIEELTAKLSI